MWGFRVILVACLVALFKVTSAATSHTVGDASGWTIPSPPTMYSTWAAKQVFHVGDSLVFNFATGSHTLEEVSQSVYESCTTTAPNPIFSSKFGPVTVNISTAGTHYYVCTLSGHCNDGQKLAITTSTSATPATAPSPDGTSTTTDTAPSPGGTSTTTDTAPSSNGTSASTPPPPSGSATVAAVGLVLPFLLVATAFLF